MPRKVITVPEGFVRVGERKPYKTGDSTMISIPPDILAQNGWEPGQTVLLFRNAQGQLLIDFSN